MISLIRSLLAFGFLVSSPAFAASFIRMNCTTSWENGKIAAQIELGDTGGRLAIAGSPAVDARLGNLVPPNETVALSLASRDASTWIYKGLTSKRQVVEIDFEHAKANFSGSRSFNMDFSVSAPRNLNERADFELTCTAIRR